MVDISNLTLEQLKRLQEKIQNRIETFNNPNAKVGDCFVEINDVWHMIFFYKISKIESGTAYANLLTIELSATFEEQITFTEYVSIDFTDLTPINSEIFNKAMQLARDYEKQINKIQEQFKSSINCLIND